MGVALRIVRDRAAAEDVLHDAFMAIWTRASTFDPARGEGRGWMCSIVRNGALSAVRASARTVSVDEELLDELQDADPQAAPDMLDAFSMRERLGSLKGKKVAIIGDILHSRVALSNMYCLNKLGAKVLVAGPPTLIPKHIESLGVNVTYNVDEALAWCDVAIVLRIQLERQQVPLFSSLREYALLYGVNTERLKKAKKDILIMHPGPINRGVEIDSAVADGPHSIILNQVENGVAIRMACLYLLAGKNESLG